jgi:hypothetical protein
MRRCVSFSLFLLLALVSDRAGLGAAAGGQGRSHRLRAPSPEREQSRGSQEVLVDTLGGTLVKFGTNNVEVIKIPNALHLHAFAEADRRHEGTTFDHMGFSVPTCARRSTASRPRLQDRDRAPSRRPTSS